MELKDKEEPGSDLPYYGIDRKKNFCLVLITMFESPEYKHFFTLHTNRNTIQGGIRS